MKRAISKTAGKVQGRGQALTEFALILPVFLMSLFGVVDLGQALWQYDTLAHAAREGSRYAALHGRNGIPSTGPGSSSFTAPNNDTNVTGVVLSRAVGLDPSRLVVRSTWPDGDNLKGSRVLVEVEYVFRPFTSSILGVGNVTMRSTSQVGILF
ncbi:MAG: pilus assembly protein [Chloroflexi bacterium]|nr:pilus assembly protein [Chloroflexota bacterium]